MCVHLTNISHIHLKCLKVNRLYILLYYISKPSTAYVLLGDNHIVILTYMPTIITLDQVFAILW